MNVKYALHLGKIERMQFLLPHRYKVIGTIITPAGIFLWLFMQLGYIKKFLVSFFGRWEGKYEWSTYHIINILSAIAGCFLFLAGLYFIAFSKEKIEDEMVQKTRLDSFQFAAVLQILLVIAGFLSTLLLGDPGEGGMLLFFVAIVITFWLSFIGRFNYILHIKYR